MQREASQQPVLRGAAAAAHTLLRGGDPRQRYWPTT